jgi:hypothetical protein
VWGMIEESELAKTIRGVFEKVRFYGPTVQRSLTLIPSHRHRRPEKKMRSSRKSVRRYPIWRTLHFVHRWVPPSYRPSATSTLRSLEEPTT